MRDAFRLAFGTLTVLPTRPPGRAVADVARTAMLLAPVAVAPLAALWALAHLATRVSSAPPLLVGALVLVVTVLYSGALHLDGLADTADGLSASRERERALAVMGTGDVGPSGVAALVLTLLVQASALAVLLPSTEGATLAVVALLASRLTLAWGCWSRVPVARGHGLGASVGGSVPTASAALATAVALALSSVAGHLAGTSWYAGPLCVVVALLGAGLVLRTAVRRLGGMTGDVLGAGVEVALAAALALATLIT